MGSAPSSQPDVGVSINPRVEYASKVAQAAKKTHLIDVPVLVDLPDGTVRYRYIDRQNQDDLSQTSSQSQLHDGPHIGSKDLEYKKGYFFHAKFPDYSNVQQVNSEDDYRLKYIFKCPKSSRNKRLYYVTGKSLHLPDQTPSYASGLNSPVWPNVIKEHKHVYFSLQVLPEDMTSSNDSMDELVEQLKSYTSILIKVDCSDTIESLKEKISFRILEPAVNIHVFYQFHEIRPGVNIFSIASIPDIHEVVKVKLSKL
ncbi:hypothetical protein EB796_021577 [Bugula neritina]|uniref:Uncharacterized protein n=1 Tax=Bugula neritina TaxID=10212 RepID=A0A7J7J233_BUGNE|nr:hypothetical protein EB796_021577 [Bugula neritina]